MNERVAALEADMKDVKAGIGRLEVAFARSEGKLDTFATARGLAGVANDVSALTERLHAHGETLTKVETAIRDLGNKVDAKLISGGQMATIFISLMGAFFVFGGIALKALSYFGMLHD